MRITKMKIMLTLLMCSLGVSFSTTGFAGITKVRCIPWQGDTTKYHTAISGQSTNLKAVIDTDGSGPIYYKWAYGDGNESASSSTSASPAQRFTVEAAYTYPNNPQAGTPFIAQLIVSTDPNFLAGNVTDTYLVVIANNTLDARVNIAIDKALWYMYKGMGYTAGTGTYNTFNGLPAAYWSSSGKLAVDTASAIQAFMINNHAATGNFNQDPYAEAVSWGLNWIFNGKYSSTPMLSGFDVSAVQNGEYAEDYNNDQVVDTNDVGADTRGIQVSYSNDPPYQGGIVIDAIITAGTPGTSTGRDISGDGNVDTYKDVVQDMVDAYAWGQSNEGGWVYSWNSYGGDNSSSQWAAIGIIPAEREWGIMVPNWLKVRNNNWLNASDALFGTNNMYNRFGYTSSGCLWNMYNYVDSVQTEGCHATTPSGMVEMLMNGYQTDSDPADPRWDKSLLFIADNWNGWLNAKTYNNNYGVQPPALYGIYAFVKAMLLARPTSIDTLTNSNGVSFDWYTGEIISAPAVPASGAEPAFSSPTQGLADFLISKQESSGAWDGYWVNDYLATSWGVIMLKPSLFSAAPVACFTASPNPGYPTNEGDPERPVMFDPTCSDHSETGKDIRDLGLFEWDWENDGTYDHQTLTPQVVGHAFPCEALIPNATAQVTERPQCNYTVKLRVTDDVGVRSSYTVDVEISNPPHPPVADADGPYLVSRCSGDQLMLDGSGSFEPNEGLFESGCPDCPPDRITSWAWDLTSPLGDDFNVVGETLFPTLNTLQNGQTNIALRVADNTAAAFPSSLEDNLTDFDFTSIEVYEGCICRISAEPGCGVTTLSWQPVQGAIRYDIYRSISGTDNGFTKVDETTNTNIVTGLDVGGGTNYFRVRAVFEDGSECMSQAVNVNHDAGECDRSVVPIPPGDSLADFRLIGFVQTPAGDPSAHVVFGPALGAFYDKTRFRFATYDPVAGNYVEYANGLNIMPGTGYFFLARFGANLRFGNGTPVPLGADFDVPLAYKAGTELEQENGWNMISPPNDANYDWADIEVWQGGINRGTISDLGADNPYIDTRLWRWFEGLYADDTTLMVVNNGYFVKVKSAGVSLRFRTADQIRVAGFFSNPTFYVAKYWQDGRQWLKKWVLTADAVAAYDNPPPPPGSLENSSAAGGGGGGCFIDSAASSWPVTPLATIGGLVLVFGLGAAGVVVLRKQK